MTAPIDSTQPAVGLEQAATAGRERDTRRDRSWTMKVKGTQASPDATPPPRLLRPPRHTGDYNNKSCNTFIALYNLTVVIVAAKSDTSPKNKYKSHKAIKAESKSLPRPFSPVPMGREHLFGCTDAYESDSDWLQVL